MLFSSNVDAMAIVIVIVVTGIQFENLDAGFREGNEWNDLCGKTDETLTMGALPGTSSCCKAKG